MIRDRILRGQIPLGAALSRRKLAAELDIGLVPVTEALQRLETDGVVESVPRVGTRVCLPTEQDIRERYEIREALESQSARLFAEKASLTQRHELQSMAEHMDAMFNRLFADGQNDADFLYAVHSYHGQLHLRIAEFTGMRALRQAIETNQVLTFNWLYDVAAHRPPLPPQFHRDLIAALCSGTSEEADRAMRQHVRYGLNGVLRGIRPGSVRKKS
jgi:DNA-binding GntR family transcriptional regulator